MALYETPGVRFEWLAPPAAVAARRTDVAGFVGIAARGPLHEPVRVENWTQFTSAFGAHIAQGYLAYAVEGFFANGGRACWVVRIADPETATAAALELDDGRGLPALRLDARSPGTWAHVLVVSVARSAPDRFALTFRSPEGAQELWRDLSIDPHSPRYVVTIVGENSQLVTAIDLQAPGTVVDRTPSEQGSTLRFGVGRPSGGRDGLATLRPEHLSGVGAPPEARWGLAALARVDEVAIVAVPDLMPKPRQLARTVPPPPRCELLPQEPPPPPEPPPPEFPPAFSPLVLAELQAALIAHCESLQDRVAILDPRFEDTTPATVQDLRRALDTNYGALYWPWLLRPDPLRLDGSLVRRVPPSGHVAGVYARGDLSVGVHKAPANERLEGVDDVAAPVDDIVHGDLNSDGINVIRAWNGPGIRVAGARTLQQSAPLLRYVNVRRLLCMIEEAVLQDTAWTVFEPNGPELWRQVDRVVRGFLDRLWRAGALDGASAADAYFVTCDEITNPEPDRDAGRLVCLVGVQPPWPAEFVIVRIGRSEGQTEIVEAAGGARA